MAFGPAGPLPLTLSDVWAAARLLEGQVERTPMKRSRTLSEMTGAEVWIKFENQQFTASFKERGALIKLLRLSNDERARGVVAASAGNHAQGVAYHANRLGIPATIVMPVTTPFTKVENTRVHGARVVLEGDTFDEAKAHAEKLEDEDGLTPIPPFADAAIMAGTGTIALEMLEDAPDLDVLAIPIGGGGLVGGMAVAAKGLKPAIRIIGVEPTMYPGMHAALNGLEPVMGGATIAEGIAVKAPGAINIEIARALLDEVLLVEESHLERAVTLYANVEKTVAEGAGAAGLAALLAHPAAFAGRKVGLVLCGGNIDTRLLAGVLTRALVRERRLANIFIVGDDRPGLLAGMSEIIGRAGANIIEVAHNRLALDVPAKGAEFSILIETRDGRHTDDVVAALQQAGHSVREKP